MNLVDAIRQASQQFQAQPSPQVNEMKPKKPLAQPTAPSETIEPVAVSPAVIGGAGSVVRLELFLSPEQMHQMLRGILQGAHTIMTLRETAQHLRTSIQTVVNLAESGEIPALMVDGQWKFPRQGVEEWMTLQTLRSRNDGHQEESDVA
jgi:excisionase family DNA binding protein